MTGHLYRLAFVCGSIVAIAASAACGGSGGGSATPTQAAVTAAAATPSIVAASTVAARVATPAAVATATQPPAPTATAVPQGAAGPPPLPTAARATPTSPPPPPPAEESLTIVAKDIRFAPSSLTAHAGGVLHLTLDNQDAGVPHDIIVYDASGAVVAGTSPENGPVQQTVTITLGAPQRYTFKCSVHPLTMNGAISVQ